MQTAEEYRRQAAICRALAKRAVDEPTGAALLQVAEAWDMLAEEREKIEKRQKAE